MDAKLKARWVKALRSGRYKRCQFVAQDSEGNNCCLGVLGRVIRQKNLLGNYYRAPLPPDIIDTGDQRDLSELNDNGATFTQIADYIERNL